MKQKVVICDVDGCVLDTSWIEKEMIEIQSEEEKFDYFNKHIGDKEPKTITKIVQLLQMFVNRADALFMRPETDKNPPCVLKQDILKCITDKFDVILAIDDDPATCEMYESHGIPVICPKIHELMKSEKSKEKTPA